MGTSEPREECQGWRDGMGRIWRCHRVLLSLLSDFSAKRILFGPTENVSAWGRLGPRGVGQLFQRNN